MYQSKHFRWISTTTKMQNVKTKPTNTFFDIPRLGKTKQIGHFRTDLRRDLKKYLSGATEEKTDGAT